MASEVKYEEQKHCCTSCAMKRRCHVCDQPTTLACSDCAIDLRAVIYVCNKAQCRDEHEKKCAHSLQSQLDALTWTPITPENVPKVGDEVGGRGWGTSEVTLVTEEKLFLCQDWQGWVRNGYTHKRPINPPPPSGAKGETKP